MTKEEYLKNVPPENEWRKLHNEYVENSLNKAREYFNIDKFIEDYKNIANEDVLKCHLADAYEENNYELGELENYLARHLLIPYKDVVEYRTQRFWDEIKNK